MSRVWVTLHDLAAGDLPPVCAKTGVDCATSCRVRFSNRPSWTTWLMPYSWYVDVDARRFTHQAVLGILPMSAPARGRSMRALAGGRLARRAALALGVTTAVAAAAMPDAFVALRLGAAAFSVLATGVALKVAGYLWSVGGRIEPDGRSVRLTGVHPRFAQAVRARDDAGPAPRADDGDVRIVPADEIRRRLAVAG